MKPARKSSLNDRLSGVSLLWYWSFFFHWSEKSKRRTKTIANTLEPHWNQTFIYSPMKRADIQTRALEVTVYDYDRYVGTNWCGAKKWFSLVWRSSWSIFKGISETCLVQSHTIVCCRIGSGEYVGETVIDLASANLYEKPKFYMLHHHESGAAHTATRGDQVRFFLPKQKNQSSVNSVRHPHQPSVLHQKSPPFLRRPTPQTQKTLPILCPKMCWSHSPLSFAIPFWLLSSKCTFCCPQQNNKIQNPTRRSSVSFLALIGTLSNLCGVIFWESIWPSIVVQGYRRGDHLSPPSSVTRLSDSDISEFDLLQDDGFTSVTGNASCFKGESHQPIGTRVVLQAIERQKSKCCLLLFLFVSCHWNGSFRSRI